MILFHESNTAIETIDFERCRPYKDFGKGFYLTEIEEQAVQMARRTSTIFGGDAVVTRFAFDEGAAIADTTLNIKRFDEPNKEWALFIMENRNRQSQHPTHSYDIVIGPVADDTIATLLRNFDDGIIDLDMLVSGLKYRKISSQYLFHTPVSLKYLTRL
ncbi:MAG: DUF3990 domain-containing protein [Rikenellaceae bacterium]